MLAHISLFHKLLIKVVIYSLVYDYFYQKSPLLYIGLTFVHFRLSGKDPVLNASFTHTVKMTKIKLHFLKR